MLSQTRTRHTHLWGIIFIGLAAFYPAYSQDCSALEVENQQLKKEITMLRAENAELIAEIKAQEVSNSFLRGKNDDLVEEVVPMRFWNTKYKRIEPRLAALENQTNKLRQDSVKFARTITQLKSNLDGELSERLSGENAIPSDAYKVNEVKITSINRSNIDAHFHLETLTKAAAKSEEDVLIKMKVFRKVKGNWQQIVYGEKGSKTYDKYYKLAFCKPNIDNTVRYHSINNFDPKNKTPEYRIEFYHDDGVSISYGVLLFKSMINFGSLCFWYKSKSSIAYIQLLPWRFVNSK